MEDDDLDQILASPDVITEEMVCIPCSEADWLGGFIHDIVENSVQGGYLQLNEETRAKLVALLEWL